jgi:L-fucose isomerase-like protein
MGILMEDEWQAQQLTHEFKTPPDQPANFTFMGNFNGMNVEFVPKSKMIHEMDKKQQAEETLDEVYRLFEKLYHNQEANFDMFVSLWKDLRTRYFKQECTHKNIAIDAQKPKKDSPMLSSFRVRAEECRLVCLDCGLTQNVQLSFGAAQSPESAPSVGRSSIPG